MEKHLRKPHVNVWFRGAEYLPQSKNNFPTVRSILTGKYSDEEIVQIYLRSNIRKQSKYFTFCSYCIYSPFTKHCPCGDRGITEYLTENDILESIPSDIFLSKLNLSNFENMILTGEQFNKYFPNIIELNSQNHYRIKIIDTLAEGAGSSRFFMRILKHDFDRLKQCHGGLYFTSPISYYKCKGTDNYGNCSSCEMEIPTWSIV